MKLQLILFAFFLGSAIAHPSNPFKKYQKIKTQGPICDICKYLITEIDSMLADDATIDEIIAALDQICDALGDLFPGGPLACKILVQVQLPQIIEDLVNTPPEEICASLGACPAVPTTTTPPMTTTTAPPMTTTTTVTSDKPFTTTIAPSTTEWKTTPTEPPMTDTTTFEPDTTTWMDTTTTSKSKAVYKLLRH